MESGGAFRCAGRRAPGPEGGLQEEERYCTRTTVRFVPTRPEQVGGDGLQVHPALRCYMSVRETMGMRHVG